MSDWRALLERLADGQAVNWDALDEREAGHAPLDGYC